MYILTDEKVLQLQARAIGEWDDHLAKMKRRKAVDLIAAKSGLIEHFITQKERYEKDPHNFYWFKNKDNYSVFCNVPFGEYIFKNHKGKTYTGLISQGAAYRDSVNHVEEHYIPRTTTGKIIVEAIKNNDIYNVFDNNCSIDNVCKFIDEEYSKFGSVIITTKYENKRLDNYLTANSLTYSDLQNFEHYKAVGIELLEKIKVSKKKNKIKKEVFLKNDSKFFPEIVTSAMKELVIA